MTSRHSLPQRRMAENFDIGFGGQTVSVTFGRAVPDAPVTEVFLSTRKHGTALDTAVRDTAMLVSWLLQYGCPLARHAHALTRDETGVPEGLAGIIVDELIASGGGEPNGWVKAMNQAEGHDRRAAILLTAPVAVLLANREAFDTCCRVTGFDLGRRYLAGLDAALGKPRHRGELHDTGLARAHAELLILADGAGFSAGAGNLRDPADHVRPAPEGARGSAAAAQVPSGQQEDRGDA